MILSSRRRFSFVKCCFRKGEGVAKTRISDVFTTLLISLVNLIRSVSNLTPVRYEGFLLNRMNSSICSCRRMYQLMDLTFVSAILASAVAQLPPPMMAIRTLSTCFFGGLFSSISVREILVFPHSILSVIISNLSLLGKFFQLTEVLFKRFTGKICSLQALFPGVFTLSLRLLQSRPVLLLWSDFSGQVYSFYSARIYPDETCSD